MFLLRLRSRQLRDPKDGHIASTFSPPLCSVSCLCCCCRYNTLSLLAARQRWGSLNTSTLRKKKNGREKGLSCFPISTSLRRRRDFFFFFFLLVSVYCSNSFFHFYSPFVPRMRDDRPEKLWRVIRILNSSWMNAGRTRSSGTASPPNQLVPFSRRKSSVSFQPHRHQSRGVPL